MTHLDITRDPETSRYEARLDGELVGWIEYFAGAGSIDLVHTVVVPEHTGGGIASTLVRHALDEIRSQNMVVIPTCDYVEAWIDRHPEYADLVRRNTAG